jgi:hypothetical protein
MRIDHDLITGTAVPVGMGIIFTAAIVLISLLTTGLP